MAPSPLPVVIADHDPGHELQHHPRLHQLFNDSWVDILDPDWGGKGDNSHDDGPVANSILASGGTSGVTLYCPPPPALYLSSVGITMQDKSNRRMLGAHMNGNYWLFTAPVVCFTVSGYYNSLEHVTFDGATLCVTGFYMKGYPQPGVTQATRMFRGDHIEVRHCKEAYRLGHYATLNGVTGDGVSPDITSNTFGTLWAIYCDYGMIQSGQNILLNPIDNLTTTVMTYTHVYLDFGGLFDCRNLNMGSTTTVGYPKVSTVGGGTITIWTLRSENTGGVDCLALYMTGAGTRVVVDHGDFTNIAGPTNIDIQSDGGELVLRNCNIDGKLSLGNTNYWGTSNRILGGAPTRVGNQGLKIMNFGDSTLADPLVMTSLLMSAQLPPGFIIERDAYGQGSQQALFTARDANGATFLTLAALAISVSSKSTALIITNYVDGAGHQGAIGVCFGAPVVGGNTSLPIFLTNMNMAAGQHKFYYRASGTAVWTASAEVY